VHHSHSPPSEAWGAPAAVSGQQQRGRRRGIGLRTFGAQQQQQGPAVTPSRHCSRPTGSLSPATAASDVATSFAGGNGSAALLFPICTQSERERVLRYRAGVAVSLQGQLCCLLSTRCVVVGTKPAERTLNGWVGGVNRADNGSACRSPSSGVTHPWIPVGAGWGVRVGLLERAGC
jgi:hypothetical protein